MRLDYDCLLDLMLCVEETCTVRKSCKFVDIEKLENLIKAAIVKNDDALILEYQTKLLAKYSNDVILYHIRYCIEDNIFKAYWDHEQCSFWIEDLTPDGHRLVGLLRNQTIKGKIKSLFDEIGSTTVRSLVELSHSLGMEALKSVLFK